MVSHVHSASLRNPRIPQLGCTSRYISIALAIVACPAYQRCFFIRLSLSVEISPFQTQMNTTISHEILNFHMQKQNNTHLASNFRPVHSVRVLQTWHRLRASTVLYSIVFLKSIPYMRNILTDSISISHSRQTGKEQIILSPITYNFSEYPPILFLCFHEKIHMIVSFPTLSSTTNHQFS